MIAIAYITAFILGGVAYVVMNALWKYISTKREMYSSSNIPEMNELVFTKRVVLHLEQYIIIHDCTQGLCGIENTIPNKYNFTFNVSNDTHRSFHAKFVSVKYYPPGSVFSRELIRVMRTRRIKCTRFHEDIPDADGDQYYINVRYT